MIIVLVGCSGAGKTFLSNILIKLFGFATPIHTTTRLERKDDNGFYKYVTVKEFGRMESENLFFVSSGDGKRNYGIENEKIEGLLTNGKNIVIHASLKDLPQLSSNANLLIIMVVHKNLWRLLHCVFFKRNNRVESLKRIGLYLLDRIKYRKYIKNYVHYVIKYNAPI